MEKDNLSHLKLTNIRFKDFSTRIAIKDKVNPYYSRDRLGIIDWGVCDLVYRNGQGEGYLVKLHLGKPKLGEGEFSGEIRDIDIYIQSKMEAKFGLKGRRLPMFGDKYEKTEYKNFWCALESRATHDMYAELEKRAQHRREGTAEAIEKQAKKVDDKFLPLIEKINSNGK